jgi:hypothetical protein
VRDRGRASGAFTIRVVLGALLALLLPSAAALPLDRAPTVQLVDSDPGQDAVLRELEPLYLRLRYLSAIPIHIWVDGYLRGDFVNNFYQDKEELFPAGNREVTVWLAYLSEANIDHVRITLWNADWTRLAVADFPIRAAWNGTGGAGTAPRGTTKSWVAKLTPGQQERMARMLRKAPIDLFLWGVPGYFLLQVVLTLCTSGGWRLATLAPTVIMVPVLAYTVLAYGQSNLWPLLLIFTAPWAALYLIVLTVILLLSRLARTA